MSWTTSGYPQQMVDVLPTEQTFRTVQRYISYKNPVAVRTFEGVVFPITSGNFDTGKKLVIQKVSFFSSFWTCVPLARHGCKCNQSLFERRFFTCVPGNTS